MRKTVSTSDTFRRLVHAPPNCAESNDPWMRSKLWSPEHAFVLLSRASYIVLVRATRPRKQASVTPGPERTTQQLRPPRFAVLHRPREGHALTRTPARRSPAVPVTLALYRAVTVRRCAGKGTRNMDPQRSIATRLKSTISYYLLPASLDGEPVHASRIQVTHSIRKHQH